jgi:putative spermidine/putrescine transport system permease protein
MKTAPYSRIVPVGATLIAIFLALPVVVIVYYAFNPSGLMTFPPPSLTFRWFVNFFANDRFRAALFNSVGIAAIVTPVTLAIAVPTAVALVRRRFVGRPLLDALIASPLVVPGVVSGVSFLNFFTGTFVSASFWRITVAMICCTLPFAVRAVVANLHGLDASLEEAGRNLGGRSFQVFLTVTLPQLRPGLLAGGIFVFVEAIDNFSITVFLSDLRTTTLPVEAYGYIRDFDDPTIAALATVLIVQSLVLVAVMQRFVGMDRFLQLRR